MVDARNYENLKKSHPCFGGHINNAGRIHLPVSPGCNIGCRFCERALNDWEDRPGVAAAVLKPEESLKIMEKALELSPEIKVAGIAGPGDTLATNYALETFRLIKKRYPNIIKCMSTNGLLLPDYAEQIIEIGIETLTVTVNAVEPEIEAKINKFIVYHGKRYEGVVAAKILIENQIAGIKKVAESGITVKINTVLIPEINGNHIGEIAKTVSKLGAKIYNLIPLIPQNDMKNMRAPSCAELNKAREEAGKYIDVFRHCQHCRADTAGIPGKTDISKELYSAKQYAKETFSHG